MVLLVIAGIIFLLGFVFVWIGGEKEIGWMLMGGYCILLLLILLIVIFFLLSVHSEDMDVKRRRIEPIIFEGCIVQEPSRHQNHNSIIPSARLIEPLF